jgi:hypothetical protein
MQLSKCQFFNFYGVPATEIIILQTTHVEGYAPKWITCFINVFCVNLLTSLLAIFIYFRLKYT